MKTRRLPNLDIKALKAFWHECNTPDMIVVPPWVFNYFWGIVTTGRFGHPRARLLGFTSIKMFGAMLIGSFRGRLQCPDNQIWLINTHSESADDNGIAIIENP